MFNCEDLWKSNRSLEKSCWIYSNSKAFSSSNIQIKCWKSTRKNFYNSQFYYHSSYDSMDPFLANLFYLNILKLLNIKKILEKKTFLMNMSEQSFFRMFYYFVQSSYEAKNSIRRIMLWLLWWKTGSWSWMSKNNNMLLSATENARTSCFKASSH